MTYKDFSKHFVLQLFLLGRLKVVEKTLKPSKVLFLVVFKTKFGVLKVKCTQIMTHKHLKFEFLQPLLGKIPIHYSFINLKESQKQHNILTKLQKKVK